MPRCLLLLLLAVSVRISLAQDRPGVPDSPQATFEQRIDALREELVAFRRDIHRNPEVSGEEERTARIVAERLRALNLEVRTDVGGHGVVAVLEGAHPGPVVAFRADMDAVFSDAPDPVEFRSRRPGIRHICGHDIHTTVGIALAEGLASIRDHLAGSVVFVFQPAEERAQGARAMIDDGALENPRPDAIFAYHTAPYEVGQIATKAGVMMAARDVLTVTLTGSNDLTEVAKIAEGIILRQNTTRPDVSSVDGDFYLVRINRSQSQPDERAWIIRANVTTTGGSMRETALSSIRSELDALKWEGINYELNNTDRLVPGVTNDVPLEKASQAALRSVIGPEGLIQDRGIPTRFSEDFGFFQDEIPGVFYYLGVSNAEKGWVGMPHSPGYVADEEAIFIGARAMAAVMLHFLNTRG